MAFYLNEVGQPDSFDPRGLLGRVIQPYWHTLPSTGAIVNRSNFTSLDDFSIGHMERDPDVVQLSIEQGFSFWVIEPIAEIGLGLA